VPSLVRLQLSGNVNQRRYKKERKILYLLFRLVKIREG
jgi:hypothetical protein